MDNKILIVDDAKFARKVLRRSLEKGNYHNIIEAVNAKEALEQFDKENPELTLLDISLPDSDDLGLLEKLLERNPKAKIIMCSALEQNMIVTEALKIGALDFIGKPYKEELLLEIVNKHLC